MLTFWERPKDPSFFFLELEQRHSSQLVFVKNEKTSLGNLPIGDGWIGEKKFLKKIVPLIKTADCMPILLEADTQFAFLHVGYKGLFGGILEQAFAYFVPNKMTIGPHIQACCYEVKEDFLECYVQEKKNFLFKENKFYFNLSGSVFERIVNVNERIEIKISPYCTFCSFLKFHSFRRTGHQLRLFHGLYD